MYAQVRHLGAGVYTGVGTAGTLDFDIRAEEVLSRFAELALDGAGVLLLLPAAVFGAVVFQRELPGFQFPSVAVFCVAVF